MAARAVYQGVGGGDLFEGQKFFLTQRVPQRNRYVGLIKANGGEVVILEKQADMIIADHVRRDQPVGSISYTWIESCIKSGTLVDIEDHRAGPANQTVRPVGSLQPTRRGRVPFTAEDDRILINWCAKAERRGVAMMGNILFQQLEAVNNRHTYQSWRDRWVKVVSHLRRPREENNGDEDGGGSLEEEDEEPLMSARPPQPSVPRVSASRSIPNSSRPSAAEVSRLAILAKKNIERRRSAAPRPLVPRPASISPPPPPQARTKRLAKPPQIKLESSSPAPSSPLTGPLIRQSIGGNVFSAEETHELMDAYDDIKGISPDQMINAWLAWESEHPNHTAQEWSNYFAEYVAPKVEEDRRRTGSEAHVENPDPSQFSPGPSTSKLAKRKSLEVKDSQGSSGQTIGISTNDEAVFDPSTTDEEVFIIETSIFAKSFDLSVDYEPVICQRKISLFTLWQIVQSGDLGGYDEVEGRRLWIIVARRLNFDDHKHPTAADELRACFKDGILADFADAKQCTEENVSLTDSQLQVLANEQLFGTAAQDIQDLEDVDEEGGAEEGDDDLDLPQSTPKPSFSSTTTKRNLDRLRSGSPAYKRQRLDKGKGKEREIPSTPEDVINGKHLPKPQIHSSPLKYTSNQPPVDNSDDDDLRAEDDFCLRSSLVRRNLSSATHPHISARLQEPETQDFTFSFGQQDELFVIDDLTPSPERTFARLPDDGGFNDIPTPSAIPSSSKNDSSTQSQTSSQVEQQLREQIDHYISLGWPEDTIVDALIATGGQDTNATHVMENLLGGEGVPETTPGIWFHLDDEDIAKRKETVGWERIVRKHGIMAVGKRKKFLKSDKFKALAELRKYHDELRQESLKQSG